MIIQFLCTLSLVLLLTSCGYEDDDTVIKKKPKPQPDPWTELAPLVASKCGSCHGEGKAQKGISSLDRLKGAAGRIRNESMPPGGGLDAETKAKLLGE